MMRGAIYAEDRCLRRNRSETIWNGVKKRGGDDPFRKEGRAGIEKGERNKIVRRSVSVGSCSFGEKWRDFSKLYRCICGDEIIISPPMSGHRYSPFPFPPRSSFSPLQRLFHSFRTLYGGGGGGGGG